MTRIIIVGGADTGRAPLAAALLRRRLLEPAPAVIVESAGILGHDEAPMQAEAHMALEHLNITPQEHSARSLSAAIVESATLLIAVDRGISRAIAMHYPEAPLAALPDLAATPRDVPDPFRMTTDAWI